MVIPVENNPEDPEAAFDKAVRVLNAASQTSSGLNTKLRRAGFSARAADEACRRAVSLGYVNDRAYAEALVGKRLRQGRGRMLISRELGHKGLAQEVVGDALGGVDAEDELRSAIDVAARLVRRHAAEADAKRRDKVLAALGRRGFSSSISRRAFAEAIAAEG
ncbi:MAG TPA: RecX family transcriptional regulator [Candidatus Dormibacteraeota bacterium]|jgi:regulatory protein